MAQNDNKQADERADAQETERDESERAIRAVTPRRKKRNGKYISALEPKALEALQRRKSLFMYLSTLFFAVSLFLKVEGRTRFSQNRALFPLFTLYIIALLALIVLSVYVSLLNRAVQKIGPELKESNVPRGGLDKHTFWSYEIFNALHWVLAAAEIAISVYAFGVWGAINIAASVASAVCSQISRQVLYKANAGNVTFIPGRDENSEP